MKIRDPVDLGYEKFHLIQFASGHCLMSSKVPTGTLRQPAG